MKTQPNPNPQLDLFVPKTAHWVTKLWHKSPNKQREQVVVALADMACTTLANQPASPHAKGATNEP